MSSKWSETGSSATPDFSEFFKEDYGVLLLRGKNNFGDHIFSYVKISLPNLARFKSAMRNHLPFNPSDFGEVIAAGTGEPTDELKAEIAAQYPMLDNKATSGGSAATNTEPAPILKKNWDEY